MVVIIPAYQPDEKFVRLVHELKETTDYDLLVVDDGSSEDRKTYFSAVAPYVVLLTHETNRGKGAALKTALAYIQSHYPASEGIVTIDADGQHLPADIVRVCNVWKAAPEKLVLGSRAFTGSVPFKSRAGNAITRFVFALSTGVRVYDTQTGLRAFGADQIPMMLEMKGDRYEYEINVLLFATRHHIPIQEVKIETVYIENNQSSHFKPFRDAWRIYKMILLFVASSLTAMLLDFILVLSITAATRGMAQSLLISVVGARILSSLANYFMNRKLVFEHSSKTSIVRYYILAAGILAINYGFMFLITHVLSIAVGKIIVELLLYPVSFLLQRKYVFPPEHQEDKIPS